jgi:autophagy-related protein 9
MDIDEENLEARFEAQDLENLLADASDSHMTTESTPFIPSTAHRKPDSHRSTAAPRAPAWGDPASARAAPMYDDDDVPESLLLEGVSNVHPTQPGRHRGPVEGLPPPVPGPSTRQARAQWETTRRHQRLHDENRGAPPPGWAVLSGQGHIMMDPKERAHWRWVNISDMDTFLAEVYTYFQGCGIYSILLRRFLALLLVMTPFMTHETNSCQTNRLRGCLHNLSFVVHRLPASL